MKTAAHNVPRLGLSREELALAIGVSPNSIDRMVDEGMLPPPRCWHTRRIWRVAEIDAFMAEWPTAGQAGRAGAPAAHDSRWSAEG